MSHTRSHSTESSPIAVDAKRGTNILAFTIETIYNTLEAAMARRAEKEPVDENGTPLPQPFTGYLVTQKLHEGPHGILWRAGEAVFDRDTVIRQLFPDMTQHEDIIPTFFGEARTVARLKHPNLVRGLDCGRAGDSLFFVCEFVPGESLAAVLSVRGRLEEPRALAIVREICQALAYLDEQGMCHSAVKPSNCMLDREGVVRLCDLGVCKDVLYPNPVKRHRLHPEYAAPEAFTEDDYLDIQSDLYSLGITLWHMLTGNVPFRGMQEVVIRAHQERDLPSIREEAPGISAATASLLSALLAKDRSARVGTPDELMELLAEHPLLPKLVPQPDATPAPTIDHE
mgnify:CR=1 FL=1